jgi:hypothetical protein
MIGKNNCCPRFTAAYEQERFRIGITERFNPGKVLLRTRNYLQIEIIECWAGVPGSTGTTIPDKYCSG